MCLLGCDIMGETPSSEGRTLYGWAFHAGLQILKRLEAMYGGKEHAEKRMATLLLNLRSELLPAKFRRELTNIIIEVKPEISFPLEIKEERAWRIDEFYRYSTAILSGFHDAVQYWKQPKKKEGEEGGKAA